MGDLSNPDYNIFPTPDSMGFQIVYEAEFPFTSLDPENLKIDFPGGYIETVIPVSELPGIPLSAAPSIDPVIFEPIESGADFVIPDISYLDEVVEIVNSKLKNNDKITKNYSYKGQEELGLW